MLLFLHAKLHLAKDSQSSPLCVNEVMQKWLAEEHSLITNAMLDGGLVSTAALSFFLPCFQCLFLALLLDGLCSTAALMHMCPVLAPPIPPRALSA